MLQWKGECIPVKPNSWETQQTLSVCACAVFHEAGDRFMSLQALQDLLIFPLGRLILLQTWWFTYFLKMYLYDSICLKQYCTSKSKHSALAGDECCGSCSRYEHRCAEPRQQSRWPGSSKGSTPLPLPELQKYLLPVPQWTGKKKLPTTSSFRQYSK